MTGDMMVPMGASPEQNRAKLGTSRSQSRESLVGRIATLLRETLDIDLGEAPAEETGLLGQGIGLDSIEVLKLVGAIEEHFDLELDDEELEARHFSSLGALVDFLAGRLAG
jgi:acyl carrier protein